METRSVFSMHLQLDFIVNMRIWVHNTIMLGTLNKGKYVKSGQF